MVQTGMYFHRSAHTLPFSRGTITLGRVTACSRESLKSVNAGGSQLELQQRPNISVNRPPRQSAPPPEQVPVEHSATYLLQSRRPPLLEQDGEALLSSSRAEDEPFAGNAMEWALRRMDKSLESGSEPNIAAKAFKNASQNPASTSAARTINSALVSVASVSGGVAKAALPVGTWVLKKGLGSAVKLISAASKDKGNDKDR